MLRSELVRALRQKCPDIKPAQVETMVDLVFDSIGNALERGDRVELRGFGAFSVRERDARQGRNPRTGVSVEVDAKRVPFFKAGKELRQKVNLGVSSARTD